MQPSTNAPTGLHTTAISRCYISLAAHTTTIRNTLGDVSSLFFLLRSIHGRTFSFDDWLVRCVRARTFVISNVASASVLDASHERMHHELWGAVAAAGCRVQRASCLSCPFPSVSRLSLLASFCWRSLFSSLSFCFLGSVGNLGCGDKKNLDFDSNDFVVRCGFSFLFLSLSFLFSHHQLALCVMSWRRCFFWLRFIVGVFMGSRYFLFFLFFFSLLIDMGIGWCVWRLLPFSVLLLSMGFAFYGSIFYIFRYWFLGTLWDSNGYVCFYMSIIIPLSIKYLIYISSCWGFIWYSACRECAWVSE